MISYKEKATVIVSATKRSVLNSFPMREINEMNADDGMSIASGLQLIGGKKKGNILVNENGFLKNTRETVTSLRSFYKEDKRNEARSLTFQASYQSTIYGLENLSHFSQPQNFDLESTPLSYDGIEYTL